MEREPQRGWAELRGTAIRFGIIVSAIAISVTLGSLMVSLRI